MEKHMFTASKIIKLIQNLNRKNDYHRASIYRAYRPKQVGFFHNDSFFVNALNKNDKLQYAKLCIDDPNVRYIELDFSSCKQIGVNVVFKNHSSLEMPPIIKGRSLVIDAIITKTKQERLKMQKRQSAAERKNLKSNSQAVKHFLQKV
jgi:hypothetical protein